MNMLLNHPFEIMVFYHGRLADEPIGTVESIQYSGGPWVMLQIVSKRKFFIKRLLSQELSYIKLFF